MMMEDADAKATTPRRKVTQADLRRVNLGKAFWGSRSDMIQHPQTRELVLRYRRNVVQMAKTGSGLMFNGAIGVGKTSAAACVVKEAVAAGLSAYFVTHTELKELRFEKKESLFGDGSDGITVRKKIETAHLLVIDGLNEPFFTDNIFGTLQLEELLIKRYAEKHATILTTRSGATLKMEKHADLFDIVSQCMVPVQMSGKNMRDRDREDLKSRVFGDD
jgi:DNA replication protein DnaC